MSPVERHPDRRRPFRCWIGLHAWRRIGSRSWQCARCSRVPKPCGNCGSQHDPDMVVFCIVEVTE